MNRRRGPSSVVFGSGTVAVAWPAVPIRAPQHSCGYVSSPCRLTAASTAAVTRNTCTFTSGVTSGIYLCPARRCLRIGGPEFFRQIFLGAVRKHGDDEALVETPGDLERRRQR